MEQEQNAATLLNKLLQLGEKHPEKWIETPYKTCFLFTDIPAISFCKYLDISNLETLSISSIDENGNTTFEVTINGKNEPDLFDAYLPFYKKVSNWASGNKFKGITASLASA
jgi:hypothetical protein